MATSVLYFPCWFGLFFGCFLVLGVFVVCLVFCFVIFLFWLWGVCLVSVCLEGLSFLSFVYLCVHVLFWFSTQTRLLSFNMGYQTFQGAQFGSQVERVTLSEPENLTSTFLLVGGGNPRHLCSSQIASKQGVCSSQQWLKQSLAVRKLEWHDAQSTLVPCSCLCVK